MDYAKKLLLETNLPIKTVAAECGYNDPAFFNYYFKKMFSVTPKAYRSTFKI
jgi:AraC-like DNA-binding protein